MWDDLDHFKLPDANMLKDKALSTTFLSETLIEITNHYLDWAQHEPDAKEEVNKVKTSISILEKAYNQDLQVMLAESFNLIPEKLQKNRDLQVGWIVNNYDTFVKASDAIREQKYLLVEKQAKLDTIQAKMAAAKQVLDVGRSILSAMKEELKNLP